MTKPITPVPVLADTGHLVCECCERPQPTTKKFPGLGYWCQTCMYEGCLSDDIDAQNPNGSPPYYQRRDANHARMAMGDASGGSDT